MKEEREENVPFAGMLPFLLKLTDLNSDVLRLLSIAALSFVHLLQRNQFDL